MEDTQITAQLFSQAESAMEALAARFGQRLYQTAENILNDPQDAEECVNDTYLAVWNTIPPANPDPLAGFVYKIGRNIAMKRLRGNLALKRNSTYDLSLTELEACIPSKSIDEQLTARELGLAIDRFLDELSRDSRVIFLRRYWFGDSVKDIAKALGFTENTVSVRLSRTRDKLKLYLTKEGYIHA